jgi:hypothetical protein
VESGKIGIGMISDWRALYQNLADVPVEVTLDMAGAQRAVMASAFPVLTGTTVVKAINDAYNAVPTIGDQLVEEIEDNKKVTTIANIHALDKNIDEVKEGDDFPEISADEETLEIRHKRNGRRLSISAEAIEENEVADIVSRVNALGQIAVDWVEEQTLYRVTDHYGCGSTPREPYVYRPSGSGTQLYNATANNPGTRAPSGTRKTSNALADETDLENARIVLTAMKNNRGKRIGIPWSEIILLIPDALLGAASKIFNSEFVLGTSADVSPYGTRGRWHLPPERIISSPKIDDMSTTAWYLGAFRRQFKRKWKLRFEYVTLGMDTQAYLQSRIAFQARIAWDCEVGAIDYVYCVQNLSGTTAPIDGLVGIAIVGMFVLGTESKDVILAIGGGLVGYLKGSFNTPRT